ncbi:RNase P modulator RnpM [Tindallia californiensis]|uniref:YlxR domain-containing protein n=1 Tax=Tindallia californiensis TaxID=159292 RepID=A0A1H3NNX3_9FIRM|nr:YlxR family protein [Tindallia californiensis]SDY90657.1 hypothetical protein SAMN05192546_105215 [Tindallia californiensis]
MKNKRIPLRKCIGCLEMKPKNELIRIVCTKDGIISLDETGKAHGRGSYICSSIECFDKAKKQKGFNRSFGKEIPNQVYDYLKSKLGNGETL